MANSNDLTPAETDYFPEFDALLQKLAAIGWVDRRKTGPGGAYKDVGITPAGVAGLTNVHALETALGGLNSAQADLLFRMAHKLVHDKPDSN